MNLKPLLFEPQTPIQLHALQVRDIIHENQRKQTVGLLQPTEPGPKEANGDFRFSQYSPARRDRVRDVAQQAAQMLSKHDFAAALASAALSETGALQEQRTPGGDAISVGAFSKAIAGLRAGLTMEHIRALAQVAHKMATEQSPDRTSSAELSRAAAVDAINSLLSGEEATPPSLFSGKKKAFADEKPSDASALNDSFSSPMLNVAARPSSAPTRPPSLSNEASSVLDPPSFVKGTLNEIKKSLYGKHVDLRCVRCYNLWFCYAQLVG